MLIIPTQAVPSQTLFVPLAGQTAQINIYAKFYGLFLDLYVNNALIIGGVICENLNRIVRSTYLGFIGDLAFIDNEGSADLTDMSVNWIGAFKIGASSIGLPPAPMTIASDPTWQGLGTRFSLVYLEAADVALLSD